MDISRKRKRCANNAQFQESLIEIENKSNFLESILKNKKKMRFRSWIQQVIEEFAYPQLQSPSIKVIEYGNQPLASPSSVFCHVSSNSYDTSSASRFTQPSPNLNKPTTSHEYRWLNLDMTLLQRGFNIKDNDIGNNKLLSKFS